MAKLKINAYAVIALAILSESSPALAEDAYNYRVTVVNRTGDHLSVICNDGNPRPLTIGKALTLTFTGADNFPVECTGYDHHGEAISFNQAVLEHHHLVHTMILQRKLHTN